MRRANSISTGGRRLVRIEPIGRGPALLATGVGGDRRGIDREARSATRSSATCRATKAPSSHHAIDAAAAKQLPLPPYSPDFNPIENAFSKLKALPRKAAARTIDELWRVIGASLSGFTPTGCANDFAVAGYSAY